MMLGLLALFVLVDVSIVTSSPEDRRITVQFVEAEIGLYTCSLKDVIQPERKVGDVVDIQLMDGNYHRATVSNIDKKNNKITVNTANQPSKYTVSMDKVKDDCLKVGDTRKVKWRDGTPHLAVIKDIDGISSCDVIYSIEDVKNHNKPEDAWTAIRGKVYDVTQYRSLHPGGVEKIDKITGKDGTPIFNSAHFYVNFNHVLRLYYKGVLKDYKRINYEFVLNENSNAIDVICDTKISTPHVNVIKHDETSLIIKIETETKLVVSDTKINWPLSIKVSPEGSVDIVVESKEPSKINHWKILDTLKDVSLYYEATVDRIKEISRDNNIYEIDLDTGNVLTYIPVGYHIRIKYDNLNGKRVVRPYTPITGMDGLYQPPSGRIRLVVKRVPNGNLSPCLTSLKKGENVKISLPFGGFSPSSIKKEKECLWLIAGGTGIAPMISFINWALLNSQLKVTLIFYNTNEDVIFWRDRFEELQKKNNRFQAVLVLTRPKDPKYNLKGYINSNHFETARKTCGDISKVHVSICGSADKFTKEVQKFVTGDLKVSDYNIF